MKIDEAAACFDALGNPTRPRTCRARVRAGDLHVTIGKLQSRPSVERSHITLRCREPRRAI
jgi:hypothetical protein